MQESGVSSYPKYIAGLFSIPCAAMTPVMGGKIYSLKEDSKQLRMNLPICSKKSSPIEYMAAMSFKVYTNKQRTHHFMTSKINAHSSSGRTRIGINVGYKFALLITD